MGRVLGVVLVAAGTVLAVGLLLVGAVWLTWDDQSGPASSAPPASPSPTTSTAPTTPEGACNGHVELCDRAYDAVAQLATHNSMAAAAEPGWFFAEQPDGIIEQLDHGVRVLLVDSWYGQSTDRPGVVATAGQSRAEAVREARGQWGEVAVRAALRAQGATGLAPRGPVRPYLCHAMCELGSTVWERSLRDLKAWLDAHPREVVTMFVQDEVTPEDTAAVVEDAGLLPYVTDPPEDGWPTLGEMVDSGQRLVVLMENHGGGAAYPWLLQGFDWVQDTPYLFTDPAEFSCEPNRGEPDASIFLVNHWIKSKTRIAEYAAAVNARDVLGPRLAECAAERRMLPNYVAVDYYDLGDALALVDELNGL
ncbi:hypothetical protein GON03_19540 [Nocardioides sp. MAH-18]|uniref:Uncharacterized protein n=1 Tax=Nocardioides agri TaxID=2682843 RepID=A0A6L6XW21_9ACTN|nr:MULTISPECIES: hypothetical protein [unclassified Nocardioides]MBA2952214.1 hypothetical protein [Nocardioides sp. CGMCC 1.13656]MVQ51379.1 hypothetical protein [Nocardioides sp. MAH-18]